MIHCSMIMLFTPWGKPDGVELENSMEPQIGIKWHDAITLTKKNERQLSVTNLVVLSNL